MLDRHYTAERINQIINHPSIFPSICGSKPFPLDMSEAVRNPDNYFLVGEHGCVLFIKHQHGIYEFHTSVLPEGRGQWMLDGAKYAFNHMFTKTDAYELMTQCPDGNLSAKAGARAVGCTNVFRTGEIWPSNGKMVCVDVWSILIQHWVKNDKYIVESGKWFHDQLEEKCKKFGKTLDFHEEDETHNRYVGATVEMLRNGQIYKAIALYNRWSKMAGYYPIKLLSLNPIIIDIRDCALRISKNDFEITAI